MIMQRIYGLEWPMRLNRLPEDDETRMSRIEEAGSRVLDRFEQMLMFRSREEAERALAGMPDEWRDAAERIDLLMLPERVNLSTYDRFGDFAFQGIGGNWYFDACEVAVFRLHATKPEAESAPALMQLEEHLIAAIGADGSDDGGDRTWHVIERQLAELAERVARAYRCEVEWLDIARP